ncbi:TonB-dependent receptor [Pseudomonas aeruginosa]|uniref:TonB-dependent receptor n=1 Tax=Pseudomonas aeruginosa TaxID=287 RepID=UPI001F428AEC|nr:TonB-dependent receptor [Pseudomonas aeruginosa]MDG4256033.1 TonB-dependent receptor [Pseudomonas aeruginosa]
MTKLFPSRRGRLSVLVLVTCTAVPGTALAHHVGSQEEEIVVLPEMNVTARRTEEHAKDLPFSVNVISGEEAEERRLYSLEDALRQTPGVDVITNMGIANTTLRMRGVGALQKISGDDTSVVINVDGMPMSASNATLDILDVERVEVLKGPQGTLFGRNAEAGAVNVVTRKPTRFFEGSLRGELGQDNQRLLEGMLSGPLSDTVSARLAIRGSGLDNYIESSQTGKPLNKPRDFSGRASLRWDIGPDSALNLSAGREVLKHRDWVYLLYPYGDPPKSDIPSNSERNRREVDRYSAEFTHQFDNSLFTALTGFARTHHRSTTPIYEGRTYTQLIGFRPDATWNSLVRERVFNHELRLSSLPEAETFWVAGANLYRSDRDMDRFDSYDTFFLENPAASSANRDFSSRAHALFAEATFPVAPATKLTLGGRYTWEKKRYDAHWWANPENPSPIREARDAQSLSDSYATGRVALSHALTPQLNLYGVYARGYKSGGFDEEGIGFTSGGQDAPYKPGSVNSYETGLKFESEDRRLTFNLAMFLNQVKNDHLLMFDPQTMATRKSNRNVTSQGLEADWSWMINSHWSVSGGLAYTRAKIRGGGDASGADGVASGNDVPEVPRWEGVLSIAYQKPLGSMFGLSSPHLHARLTNRYVGSRAATPQNNFDLASYNKLDFRVGIRNGGTELYVWADNLLDKQYDLYGYHIPAYMPGGADARIGAPGRERTLGVGMTIQF